MSLHRRRFLAGAATAALATPAIMTSGRAQSWPDKPVKVIVPYAAGGGTDIIARPWAEMLGQALGQPFVIENRGGASGMIGAEAVAKAAPDGNTLLFTPNNPLSVLQHLRKVPYDAEKNFEPIGRAGDMVIGFAVHPGPGIKSFKDLIDHAKKNPGKLAFASSGVGTVTQLRLEMLKLKAGIDILHVPYRGGADALNDLLAGNAQMMNESSTIPHVKAGKLTLLNVNHTTRSPLFPDVPTLTEAGYPNSDCPIWFSLWAPAGTPKEITGKIGEKMRELAKNEALAKRLIEAGYVVGSQTPDELKAFLVADSKINGDLIKAANIKAE